MVKPASMKLWDQVKMMFEIPEDHEPSIAHRKTILSRMFPDVHCEFDTADFHSRSMWESFFDQRKEHGRRNTSDDESEEEEPQPKKSKAELSKGKSSVIDSDEESPPREPEPPAKLQRWTWDEYRSRQRMPWVQSVNPDEEDMMWRHGDPPSVWQMCDSPRGETVMGLTAIETGNLLVGLHPRDIKKHGYVLTRLLCTLRYLECSRPAAS